MLDQLNLNCYNLIVISIACTQFIISFLSPNQNTPDSAWQWTPPLTTTTSMTGKLHSYRSDLLYLFDCFSWMSIRSTSHEANHEDGCWMVHPRLLLVVLPLLCARRRLYCCLRTIVISPWEQAMVGYCLIPVEKVASLFLMWPVIDYEAKQGATTKTIAEDWSIRSALTWLYHDSR